MMSRRTDEQTRGRAGVLAVVQPVSLLVGMSASLFFFGITSPSHAGGPNKGAGTTGATFLNIYPGARYEGQGGAAAADADGIDAVYWNPAGLGRTQKQQFSFVHNNYMLDISNNYIAYAYPMKKNGVVGFSFYQVDIGDISRTEVDGNGDAVTGLGDFDASDMAFQISYGKIFGENILLGMSLKHIRSEIEKEMARGYAADFGFQYKLADALSVGLTVHNLGPQIKFVKQNDDLPLKYKFGMAYHWTFGRSMRWRFGADMTIPARNKTYYGGGTEVWFWNMFALRFGYDHRNRDLRKWLTAGLGAHLGNLNVDYAYIPHGSLKSSHRFGFAFQF